MSEIPTKCPYCDKAINVEIEGVNDGDTERDTCPKCDKQFKYYISYSVDIYPDKLEET